MGIVRKIKEYFFTKALDRLRATPRNGCLPSKINNAIFLLEKHDDSTIRIINKWCDDAQIGTNERKFIVFSNNSDSAGDAILIDKKSLTWYEAVKDEVLNDLKAQSYDFLINLDANFSRPMLYTTMAVNADFKVGLLANSIKIYDLLIEGNPQDLKGNLHQISTLLNQINN